MLQRKCGFPLRSSCYAALSSVSNFSVYRLSYILYGDSTLTGRTIIWDFASAEIARRPLFGWGYQSFWLVGDYDTTLEIGYVGYYLLVIFIIATLHAIGRVAYRDPNRAWLLLSLALYFMAFNYLESLWMRGFEFLWVVFLIIAAEIGRYWQPLPQKSAEYGSRIAVSLQAARGRCASVRRIASPWLAAFSDHGARLTDPRIGQSKLEGEVETPLTNCFTMNGPQATCEAASPPNGVAFGPILVALLPSGVPV